VPRLAPATREARRAEIVAAARRCFARDGFHVTTMPDVAREAGLSTGAAYRYFTGKEDLVLEVAQEAFALLFSPLDRLLENSASVTVAEVVDTAVSAVDRPHPVDAAGHEVSTTELLQCAVQAWSEVLRHEGLRRRAEEGVHRVLAEIADLLRRGQTGGTVHEDVDVEGAARVVLALVHGFALQRTAFGLHDVEVFTAGVRALTAPRSR
jgi:AcrR family transcriptional regulator